jgi:hypothetical protein
MAHRGEGHGLFEVLLWTIEPVAVPATRASRQPGLWCTGNGQCRLLLEGFRRPLRSLWSHRRPYDCSPPSVPNTPPVRRRVTEASGQALTEKEPSGPSCRSYAIGKRKGQLLSV